jgi:hypothetical protein
VERTRKEMYICNECGGVQRYRDEKKSVRKVKCWDSKECKNKGKSKEGSASDSKCAAHGARGGKKGMTRRVIQIGKLYRSATRKIKANNLRN